MNYIRIYNSLIDHAKHRIIDGYTEKHHIQPSSLLGDNTPQNMVNLTLKEHMLAHTLLAKIYPNQWWSVEAISMRYKHLPKWKRRQIAFNKARNIRNITIDKY